MSRQLYEEAIADAKQIQSVAEDNAKRAIIEAVTPRIRALIERNLMEGPGDGDLGDDSNDDILLNDESTAAGDDATVAAAISPPGADGKLTLDLDGLSTVREPDQFVADQTLPVTAVDGDFALNAESLSALEPILAGTNRFSANEVELQTYRLGESIARFSRAGRLVRSSKVFGTKIVEMISRVKNTYECVQESVKDPARKRSLEMKLEAFNRALGRLTEMTKQRRGSRVNEGDVTLKLTGLPDELDLDGVGVDLIKDDEDSDGGDDLDLDGGGDDGDSGGDLDLDAGGDDNGGEGDIKMGEGRRLGDDTVVEIDESMLRREISRMRSVREEAVPSTKGHAPRGSELDDFGGGGDEGDPWLDSDVPKGGLSLKIVGESDEPDGDEVLEIDMGEGEPPVDECDAPMEATAMESAKRRLPRIREAIRRARRSGDSRKLAEATAAYRRAARAARGGARITGGVAEARSSRSGARSNSGPRRTTTEGGAAERNLRMQLMQSNLRNAKLTATAKLLQNESLSARHRADIVEQLEAAKSPREVKLIYGSLTSTLVKNTKSLSESAGRRVVGSSSRVTRPASTVLNESTEAARWAQLAGIR